jgi:hypothetical protein
MAFEPEFEFEPAPECFRELFSGQALSHLDEMVLSWRMGGHPIDWTDSEAAFQVHLADGPACLFRVFAPSRERPASIEVDTLQSSSLGVPPDLIERLWSELADIGKLVENPHVPLSVPLGKFSRGDRKVFLAYALTIARCIAVPPECE